MEVCVSHPVPLEVLVSLALGELDEAHRTEVEASVRTNPESTRLLNSIMLAVRTMRADDSVAPPDDVLHRVLRMMRDTVPAHPTLAELAGVVREYLCRLVRDTLTEPALAGFRGTTESRHISFECDIAEIDLQVAPVQGETRRTIRGQIAPLTDGLVSRVGWRPTLTGTAAQEVSPDESGMFVLECPVGVYELTARIGDHLVRLPPINVA
jgi:hypothetical protein